ncbi:MAG: hypoxanthine-guanine phosphoribosyltransferase [Wenzhouxiangellaceae bacterium]|nr:hypoxanthine-guanine phosphoribosyltransferase [Wenzhouxiangellaceae bacterium]
MNTGIPADAERLFARADIDAAYVALADRVGRDLPDETVLLLPVMNGGMFPAVELARRLDHPVVFDYVHATRYRGETRGGEIEWRHWPDLEHEGSTVLLVDDIFDEGYTMQAIRERLSDRYRVVTAVLARKLHERGLSRDWVDHHGLDVPDRYVFGCGMDLEERFRELPEIWALPGDDR